MIDAYEIGIQLLLQEDVSAGLAVINRGLAEVDRAIAATSADLVGLVHVAENATQAIAGAMGGRSVLAPTPDHQTSGSTDQAVRRQPDSIADTTRVPSSSEAAAPEFGPVETPVPAARLAGSLPKSEQTLPRQELHGPTAAPSMPATRSSGEDVTSNQPLRETPVEPAPPITAAPVQVAPTAPVPRESTPSIPVRDVSATAHYSRRNVTPLSRQMALTASISRPEQQKTGRLQPEQVKPKSTAELGIRRDRPVAPWTGVDQFGPHAETTRLHDRAVAPQTESKSRSEVGGGTVMLDGRLVGHWLSEHMAREASRPPVGTSFFDPRQTPAWNVSGAL